MQSEAIGVDPVEAPAPEGEGLAMVDLWSRCRRREVRRRSGFCSLASSASSTVGLRFLDGSADLGPDPVGDGSVSSVMTCPARVRQLGNGSWSN